MPDMQTKTIDTAFALKLLANAHNAKHYLQLLGKYNTEYVDRMVVVKAVQQTFPLSFALPRVNRG